MLGMTDHGFGLFAGTAVNDTSSVVAAGYAFSEGAGDFATMVKLTRTLAIIPITLVLAIVMARKENAAGAGAAVAGPGTDGLAVSDPAANAAAAPTGARLLGGFSLKRAFPTFILLFLAASVITTVAVAAGADAAAFAPLKALSKFFIVMAMAAIGLNTDLV